MSKFEDEHFGATEDEAIDSLNDEIERLTNESIERDEELFKALARAGKAEERVRALEYDLEQARGALRHADFLAEKKIQEIEKLKDNPGPDWITRSQADDSIEKAIAAERTARESAEARVRALEGALDEFPSDTAMTVAMETGGATLRGVLDAYHRADVLRCNTLAARALRGGE